MELINDSSFVYQVVFTSFFISDLTGWPLIWTLPTTCGFQIFSFMIWRSSRWILSKTTMTNPLHLQTIHVLHKLAALYVVKEGKIISLWTSWSFLALLFRRTVLPAVNPCYLPVCNEVGRDSTVIVAIVTTFLSGLSLTPWTSMSASSGWDHPVIMMNR